MSQPSVFGERRFHDRKECIVAVEINDFEGFVKGNMRNIGLGGAFVDTQLPFAQKPGQDVIITIPFQLQSKKITLKGRVTRVRSNGMGIAFAKDTEEI